MLYVDSSCSAIQANDARRDSSPEGVYRIDPDGDGGIQPFNVTCLWTTSGEGTLTIIEILFTSTKQS